MKKTLPLRYDFPYVKFHGRFYPLIPITLKYRKHQINTFALLDSGASVCVFRPEIAKQLGIRVNKSKSIRLGTAMGGINVAMVRLQLQVQKTKFMSPVGFTNQQMATFNIIGREGFFRKFSIAFNEISRTVVLVPLETLI